SRFVDAENAVHEVASLMRVVSYGTILRGLQPRGRRGNAEIRGGIQRINHRGHRGKICSTVIREYIHGSMSVNSASSVVNSPLFRATPRNLSALCVKISGFVFLTPNDAHARYYGSWSDDGW